LKKGLEEQPDKFYELHAKFQQIAGAKGGRFYLGGGTKGSNEIGRKTEGVGEEAIAKDQRRGPRIFCWDNEKKDWRYMPKAGNHERREKKERERNQLSRENDTLGWEKKRRLLASAFGKRRQLALKAGRKSKAIRTPSNGNHVRLAKGMMWGVNPVPLEF